MEWISLIGIIAAIGVFLWLSFKGMPMLFIAPVASIVIFFFNMIGGDATTFSTMLETFGAGAGGTIAKYLLLFCMSALFGKLVGEIGIAASFASSYEKLIHRASKKYQKYLTICLVPLANAIFVYAGVNLFVVTFTVVAIARDLFKKMDIPWHLYAMSMIGSATFAASTIPGSPQIQNLMPIEFFGTTAMAAPVLSIVLTLVSILLGLNYIRIALKKTEKNGEGFMPTGAEINEQTFTKNADNPVKLIPALVLVFLPVILMNVAKIPAVPSLMITNVVLLAVYYKRFPDWATRLKALGTGVTAGVMPLITMAVVTGFGKVLTASAGFNLIFAALESIPGPAYIRMVVMTIVCAFLLGGSTNGMTVTLNALGAQVLQAGGITPEAMHRLAVIGGPAGTGPHAAGICNSMHVAKLTHKQAYKHYFMIGTVNTCILCVVACILVALGVQF